MRLDRDLVQISQNLSPVDLQNRLLRASDRDIALALSYLSDKERLILLQAVGGDKRRRVQEELSFHRRVVVQRHLYIGAMTRVLALLKNGRGGSAPRSHLKRNRN